MTDLDPRGADHDALVRIITASFPDSGIVAAIGPTFFSLPRQGAHQQDL